MKVKNDLLVEQCQKLNLNHSIKQSLEILRLSQQELREFLEEELLNNQVLKIENSNLGKPVFNKSKPEKRNDIYQSISSLTNISLFEYLNEQIIDLKLNHLEKKLTEFIIGNIDQNGYLQLDTVDIVNKFKVNEEISEKMITCIQKLDPSGICARNLRESLLIQLKRKKLEETLAYKIVKSSLEDLAENKLKKISLKFKISIEEILDAKKIITSLNPRPGAQFNNDIQMKYVEPDVIVHKINGEYKVNLNKYGEYNEFKIDTCYVNINKKNYTKEEFEYLSEKINTAKNILNSIKQRNATILNVTIEIVKHQIEFFDNGKFYLKPYTRKTIAKNLKIHESTVSRAVRGKFLKCDRGIFELSYFFQNGIEMSSGKTISAEKIKIKIDDIIKRENPKKPFSDKEIADTLNYKGIKISRRCVAKYRNEINILSSTKRKIYI